MKKLLLSVKALLPHVVIDLSAVFMVFLVLNKYNPMMGFLTNRYSQPLLWLLCVASLTVAILQVRQNRSEGRGKAGEKEKGKHIQR